MALKRSKQMSKGTIQEVQKNIWKKSVKIYGSKYAEVIIQSAMSIEYGKIEYP